MQKCANLLGFLLLFFNSKELISENVLEVIFPREIIIIIIKHIFINFLKKNPVKKVKIPFKFIPCLFKFYFNKKLQKCDCTKK